MAKRFIDTGIFDDTWFMDLSKDAKIAWLYLITKCDHAGIIEINEKLIVLQTGIKSWSTVRQELNSRLINLRDKYFFIPKFIQFQYPNFPKSNVNQQSGAIKRFCEFGLFCDGQVIDLQALNSSSTLSQDLAKSYGNGNDILYSNKKKSNSNISNSKIDFPDDDEIVKKELTWRDDFNVYKELARIEFDKAWNDEPFLKEMEYFYPALDIKKTLHMASKYWFSEDAWNKKRVSKIENINWRLTIANAFKVPSNKIYKDKQ